MIKSFFFLIFLSLSLQAAQTCFFIPPKGWDFANPDMLAPRAHVCFLGKSSKGLAPSVNLATEAVRISLDAYVEEVRKIHASDPNSRWRDLGPFKTLFGTGRLTELELPTPLGSSRLVQLIVIKDHVAYILTAGSLKEEFSKYYKTFDQVLRSLQFSSDLIASYPSKPEQTRLRQWVQQLEADLMAQVWTTSEHLFSLKKPAQRSAHPPLLQFIQHSKNTRRLSPLHLLISRKQPSKDQVFFSADFQSTVWKPFEEKIINDFTEMGPYWQILLLRDIQATLLTARSK